MDKKPLIGVSIFAMVLLVMGSLSNVVGYLTNCDYENDVVDNHPPDAPKITGPIMTTPGPHEWTFKAIDPDGDNVSYEIDWADGTVEKWVGPHSSGEEVTRSHTYNVKMVASIRARANDTHGAVGDWGFLDVVISKSNEIMNLVFLQFLERYPHAFPILRYLLVFNS